MAKVTNDVLMGTEKEFLDMFQKLCYCNQSWSVWADLMTVFACTISNSTDRFVNTKRYEERENEYLQAIKRLGDLDTVCRLFNCLILSLEKKPNQDFLGDMYMKLNLGSHWHGQFFTPYHLCVAMSQISITKEDIEQKGFVSVLDPSCGAGATLVAAAEDLKRICGEVPGLSFHDRVLFVGQDIDPVAAKMCYIQLSLHGCAGYVCVANTLSNPLCGDPIMPLEKSDQEFWYTPMFYSDAWTGRRMARQMDKLLNKKHAKKEDKIVNKDGKVYFIFTEEDYGSCS